MISMILIFFSGMFFAAQESLGVNFYSSIFYRFICCNHQNREQWWNASLSWRNKYKSGHIYMGRKSFSLFSIKFNTPSLFYSASDLFKWLHIILILLSIPLYSSITSIFYLDFFVLLLIWNSSFIFFKSIFVK